MPSRQELGRRTESKTNRVSTANDRSESRRRRLRSLDVLSSRRGARKLSLPRMVIYPHYRRLVSAGCKEKRKEQPAIQAERS